jgi:glycosyltransferase involved in cell wall biosynthesis
MLTVLIATKNRAGILNQVLEAYCHLAFPTSSWKLVVADNGSTDETLRVLESFSRRLPLQWIVEPKGGKNTALNASLKLVEGDLVVLSDDDAFPHPEWLTQLRKAVDEQPDFAMFGGVVLPRWEKTPPEWVEWVNTAAAYAITNPGLSEGAIDPTEIFGPNMAIRSSIFSDGHRFNTTIGPNGPSYAMGSETEFVVRLGRQGYKAWRVKNAVVEHFIRAEQLEQSWVLDRAVRFGRGQFRLYGPKGRENPVRLGGVPLYLYRKMLKQAALVIAGRVTGQSEVEFRAHWRLNEFRGEVMEARLLKGADSAQLPSIHTGAGNEL